MVNEKRLLQEFAELVEIDSPSLGERAMCDRLKQKLTALGLTVEEDDAAGKINGNSGNLFAVLPATAGCEEQPPVLLCAHMDTVEPSCGKKAVFLENGRITSQGDTVLGADDLAGVVSILEGIRSLQEEQCPHGPVEILFSAAEELYCVGVREFDFTRIRSDKAYVFDLTGRVGEAANAAPTIFSFQAEFEGVSAHAGFEPEKGVHAIQAAARAVTEIPCGRVGNATVNIGTIQGGKATNIVPAACTITGEIRSFVDSEVDELFAGIREKLTDAAKQQGAGVRISGQRHVTAYEIPVDAPVVDHFREACRKAGLTPEIGKTYGGSDNNYLALHGIPGLVVATAMQNCHSCEEYTEAKELVKAAKLAEALIKL